MESTINKISTTTDNKKVDFNKLSDSKKPNSVILPSETNIKQTNKQHIMINQ